MATNLKINDKLLARAVKVGKHRTKREAVEAALTDYIRMLRVEDLLKLEGTIEYLPGEDPMSRRQRERSRISRKAS